MKYSIIRILSFAAIFLVSFQARAQKPVIKLSELVTCFTAPEYPVCLFEMLEARGLYRVDKQYLPNCERVIYTLVENGKPSLFFNPMLCEKPSISEKYPVRFKSELEIQFQKGSRAYFENLNALIKKQCQLLPTANDMVTGNKSALRAYKHPAGIVFIVQDTAPVSFIYLTK